VSAANADSVASPRTVSVLRPQPVLRFARHVAVQSLTDSLTQSRFLSELRQDDDPVLQQIALEEV
jgi:hypothetical protein